MTNDEPSDGPAPDSALPIDLVLFEHRPERVREAYAAGISSFIVDCENQRKKERQAGYDTEIKHDVPADLAGITVQPGVTAFCRIDGFGDETERQVDQAIRHGAGILLLPMVTGPAEVERFLRFVDGRCRAGILIETDAACRSSGDLAEFPLDAVYIGLNDLMIGRRSRNLFAPILDGTLERVREFFPTTPFGFGGATDVDRGFPVPCRMLLGEMARLRCRFTFLRRSFKRDVPRGETAAAVSRIRECWQELVRRPSDAVRSDHLALRNLVAVIGGG